MGKEEYLQNIKIFEFDLRRRRHDGASKDRAGFGAEFGLTSSPAYNTKLTVSTCMFLRMGST